MKDKRFTISLIIVLVGGLLIGGIVYYSMKRKGERVAPMERKALSEEELKKALETLTAPAGEIPSISKKVMDSVSAPKIQKIFPKGASPAVAGATGGNAASQKIPIPQEVIDSLTAPR